MAGLRALRVSGWEPGKAVRGSNTTKACRPPTKFRNWKPLDSIGANRWPHPTEDCEQPLSFLNSRARPMSQGVIGPLKASSWEGGKPARDICGGRVSCQRSGQLPLREWGLSSPKGNKSPSDSRYHFVLVVTYSQSRIALFSQILGNRLHKQKKAKSNWTS